MGREGDTSVMLLQTARFLLKCCEDAQLGKELPGLTAIFAVMADADFDASSQRPPEPSTASEFLDLDFLLSLFEYRTLVAVSSLNRALQARLAEGEAFEDAWSALTLKACKTVSRCKIVLRRSRIARQRQLDDLRAGAIAHPLLHARQVPRDGG